MLPHHAPSGLVPVMLTPFKPDGAIDYDGVDALVEFYLEAGASGLFANCLSSEMYELTPEERLSLTHHVVSRVNSRVPVVATGTFGGPIPEQAAFIRRMADTGVTAVILISNQLTGPHDDGAVLQRALEEIVALTEDVPLGTYECPAPYKVLLDPGLLRWAADTGRFIYHKDTSCDLRDIGAKLDAVRHTGLGLYNANTPTALDSLRAGARGLSAISANFYPELYSHLCRISGDPSWEDEAAYLQRMLAVMDGVTRLCYPLSAKQFLQARGLPIGTTCRIAVPPLAYEIARMLAALRETFGALCFEMGLRPVHPLTTISTLPAPAPS